MAGRAIAPEEWNKAWALKKKGITTAQIHRETGISESQLRRAFHGYTGSVNTSAQMREKLTGNLPDPKPFEKLSDPAKRGLEDFNFFCEYFLARDPMPWRLRAAKASTEYLLDRSERDYVVANTPPGPGKSTLWTHDIPLWLVCGGGSMDPGYGRALRFMLGHASKEISQHYVQRLRRVLDLKRPFYDKEQRRSAEGVLALEYGRFKPDLAAGDPESVWAKDQFLVAQIMTVDLYEKEPTFQAASRGSEFIGERVDYAVWDDLVTQKNSYDPDVVAALTEWFEKEAETRVEPGGVLWLIGQRIGPLDLFRDRLNQNWVDDEGQSHQKYEHIVFPAHHEATCDVEQGGEHRQWDAWETGTGCLLDAKRLPWIEIMKVRGSQNFRTLYQQEDTDPTQVLVLPVWLDGGTDIYGDEVPGCWDKERGFYEWPEGVQTVNYVTVDVASGSATGGWWAIEWWAVNPISRVRWLIYGLRAKLPAGGPQGFLDWDPIAGDFQGVMNKLQVRSIELNHPIRVWVIEANAAQRHLFSYNHFDRWQRQYGKVVTVIPHQTQKNKHDPVLGVEATLPMAYRSGLKRLPRSSANADTLNYMRVKQHELTTYPHTATTDTVMADWFGECNLEEIIRLGSRTTGASFRVEYELPPYLRRQLREVRTK